MEHKNVLSDFIFIGSVIKNINLTNKVSGLPNPTNIAINVGTSEPTIFTSEGDGAEYEGRIALKLGIDVADSEGEVQSRLSIEIEGCFGFPSHRKQEDFAEKLMLNGITALYSIARSEILSITAHTYIEGKIALPMFNVDEYYKAKIAKQENNTMPSS